MTTLEIIEQKYDDVEFDDNLDHLVCDCNSDIALCGTDVSDVEIVEEANPSKLCIVCKDLMYELCKFCN